MEVVAFLEESKRQPMSSNFRRDSVGTTTRTTRTQKGLSSLRGSKVPPGVNELVKTKLNRLQEAETNEVVKADEARWVSARR